VDFAFTEEQELLRDTLAGYLRDHYDFETRRKVVGSEPGWRPAVWRALAQELNIFGAAFPETLGGLGGNATEHSVVMEEFGKALVVEPYLGTLVIGGGLLKHSGGALAAEFVPQIIAGDAVLAWAGSEPQARYNAADLLSTAKPQGDGFVLDGRKSQVVGAAWTTHFIVSARSAGAQSERDGVTLLLVDAGAPGIRRQDYPTIDGGRASEVWFDQVKAPASRLIGKAGTALPLIEQVSDEAICALCAEAVGAMRRMLAETVGYASQRKQFGTPLASFQVLQHRMADMYVALEQSIALTQAATMKLDGPAHERALAASAAKAQIGNAAKFIGQAAVQIHGGMGITEELSLGHYFRRTTAIASQFGSVDHHLRRYADLSLAA